MAGKEGTFRSPKRAWKKVVASSPLVVETLDLREVILARCNLNWRKVIFESDCLSLIEACRKDKVVAEIQGIVVDILTVSEGFIHWGFTWVQHQSNKVALQLSQASTPQLPSSVLGVDTARLAC
ncbi:Reverse transcriptase-like [Sesbania bispinosa]|nr:Reverse transcriptase-like [Sesbania bispinosa]